LVKECIKKNIKIFPIPGPSSVISAVSISGFSDQFFFYGFFPEKRKKIIEDLSKISEINSSIVFFVTSKKIKKIVPYLKEYFIGRKILVCKEMTKYFEEFIYTDINKLALSNLELKGELTIVISEKKDNEKDKFILSVSDKKNISRLINKLSIKEIVKIISENKKISKKEIYNYCIKLKND
jgi:16S rRNA (cytidine1402-2'-O)-methyltransferase